MYPLSRAMQSQGYISSIHGDVVEIDFPRDLPRINDALVVHKPDKTSIIMEVCDHTSPTSVKSIALGFTQGLQGMNSGAAWVRSGSWRTLRSSSVRSANRRIPVPGHPSRQSH